MRYSEMIAREKHDATRRGELPGGVSDLSAPNPVWILGALLLLLFLMV